MSEENVEVVRYPLRPRERSGRTLSEQLAVRLPRFAAASASRIATLSPGSRLRKAGLSRVVCLALEAYNRRDLDAVVSTWHTECEYHPGHDWVKAGLVEPSYLGPDGYRRYVATVDEVWGGENRLRPTELIDLGDRILTLAEGTMRGQASGVTLNEAFALLTTLKDGRPIRHEEYYDHAEALKAVGLPG
jgi:ketosteroid isomerase-like protein